MKAVGIKVLKDNLSKYLRYVREGETVYVTDRDTVVAEIHQPSRPIAGQISRWEAFLLEARRSGAVIPAARADGPGPAGFAAVPRTMSPDDVQSLVDETRED